MNDVLPRLILIADRFTESGVSERILQAVGGGVPWVHLRDHAASYTVFAAKAKALLPWLKHAQVSINTHVGLAAEAQTGAHIGTRGPAPDTARRYLGKHLLLGLSVHPGDVLPGAVIAKINYVMFGPVYPTGSKPGHPGTGVEGLAAFCRTYPGLPVFSLGGITPERVPACLQAGAYGIAVLSGILHAQDPGAATRWYLKALAE